MYLEELLIISIAVIGIYLYRKSRAPGLFQFIKEQFFEFSNKFAPYTFQTVSQKAKELGQEYSKKQYTTHLILVGLFAATTSYLYFYSIPLTIIYTLIATSLVPYFVYLKYKRIYSEFIFEQIQIYASNVLIEFSNTKSFVKALENIKEKNLVENPLLTDIEKMISLSYEHGTIDEAIKYMNELYPYQTVKNLHQLILQITKEEIPSSKITISNFQLDIDALIEEVNRDRYNRSSFHKDFLQISFLLYLLIIIVQYIIGKDTYVILLSKWHIQLLLHSILLINTYFLVKEEKYYNENVGVE